MMRTLFLLLAAPLSSPKGDEIRAMLKNSEAAWNRGDLAAFATDYEDSAETTFIGRDITHGRSPGDSRPLPPRLSHARSHGHADLFRDRGAALG